MFISGEKDGLVPPKRISQYMMLYGSKLKEHLRTNDKHMIVSKKSHTEERETQIIDTCLEFLRKHVEADKKAITNCYKNLQDMKKYKRIRPARLDFMKAPHVKTPQVTNPKPQTQANFFNQPERKPAEGHRRQDSASENQQNRPPFAPIPQLLREARDQIADTDTPNLQSTKSSDDIKQPTKPAFVQQTQSRPQLLQVQNKAARQNFDPYQLRDLPQEQTQFRRSPTESSNIGLGLLKLQKFGSFEKPQANKPSRSRIFDDDQEEPTDGQIAHDPRAPLLHQFTQPLSRSPFQEFERSQNTSQRNLGRFESAAHLRQPNHFAPGIAHLDHFSSTIKRPALNLQNQYSRQPQVEVVSDYHQPHQDPRRLSRRDDLQARFDEEDLSLLLDSNYQIFQDKNHLDGQNLDDSMVQDLQTLNSLLKKAPR